MSDIPKYSQVQLEERRRREAQAALEAERRRQAAETAARRQRLLEEHARQFAAKQAELAQRQATLVNAHEQRVATAVEQSDRRMADSAARLEAAAAQAAARMEQRATPRQQATPAEPAPAPAPEGWAPPPFLTRTLPVVQRVFQQRAEAGTLIDALATESSLTGSREALVRSDAALEQAFEHADDAAVEAAAAAAAQALEAARAEHEELIERRERRRIIARAIVEALPERYVVQQTRPVEDADGRIYFSATAPDRHLEVTVTGDGTRGGDVIAYQADGVDLEQHVEDGRVVSDCPRFSDELEQLHERLEPLGVQAGELHWEHEPLERKRAHRTSTRRESRTR